MLGFLLSSFIIQTSHQSSIAALSNYKLFYSYPDLSLWFIEMLLSLYNTRLIPFQYNYAGCDIIHSINILAMPHTTYLTFVHPINARSRDSVPALQRTLFDEHGLSNTLPGTTRSKSTLHQVKMSKGFRVTCKSIKVVKVFIHMS